MKDPSSHSLDRKKLIPILFIFLLILLALLTLIPSIASAAGTSRRDALKSAYSQETGLQPALRGSRPAARFQQVATTTLSVNIVSSPWATRDHNWTPGSGEEVPRVFVVAAVITNTGSTSAEDLSVYLDYNEDPINNWVLLAGENPFRGLDSLAPGQAYYAYWFTRYSQSIGASHQYTVTAQADNADPVATSDNAYGNPLPGQTVQTRSTVSTGNSGVSQVNANVIVGVAFTVTVDYDLGSNPQEAGFSPVGNLDFDPSAYRLLASQVRFYNDAGTQQSIVADRLYFDTLPTFADNAQVTYTFIALTPADTRLCSYTAVGYNSTDKYDQFYCSDVNNTTIEITGSLSISVTKYASTLTVQQNQPVTYTLAYTNNGSLPLSYAWIWDTIDTDAASVIDTSIIPPADPDATTGSLVAWYLDDVQPGETGTLSFAVLVDGAGQDLADQTPLLNQAFFGINQGSLPASAALTRTVTTIVEAPLITLSKTDGQTSAEPGDSLTYQLEVANLGTVVATGVMVTDVLPTGVSYVSGTATPSETSRDGQTLVWASPDVPPDGSINIEVPVTVGDRVANGTLLLNTMHTEYQNPAGWTFATPTTTDITTVDAPVLSISKSDFPDPVLTGHTLTYTLHYSNSGPAAASNVTITDVVPLSTTFQSCSPSCSLDSGRGTLSWSIGNLAGNTSGTASFSVLVSTTLDTDTLIRNDDYGILSNQTFFTAGLPILTSVSRDAAFIEGHAFVDADGDGIYDQGLESILPGITITLSQATVPITNTDVGGSYRFRVESQGPISITAGLPSGYFRTTPGAIVFLESIFGDTRTVDFGYAPITSTFGVIYGTVFEDSNRDASQNVGENGLTGVSIASTQAATSPVTTNALGQYTLRFDSAGQVSLLETDPVHYVSTTPNEVTVTAVTGSSGPSPIDFGDFAGIMITGQVFQDTNVNGAKDENLGVSGALVLAAGDSHTTAASGVYTLYTSVQDSTPILIRETDPPGYLSTNALPGTGMDRINANTLRIAAPVSGTIYSGGDFGDVQASTVVTVSGQVWNDNGAGGGGPVNGIPDGTEPGLAGAVASLSSGLTQTTAADGAFVLYAPNGQAVTLIETPPAGYVATNAIPGTAATKIDNQTLIINALGGGSTAGGHRFGNVLLANSALISGTVFDDANENGTLDDGETGLPGVSVTLELNGDPPIVVTTDAAGHYQFAIAPGAEARITSAGPGGAYFPTTLESAIVRPPTSSVFPGNNFGYTDDDDVAVIFGLVFDDLNSDGEQDFGEVGLSGAVMTLNGANPVTTTNNGLIVGTFTFDVSEAAVHALHETNPAGYRSTTPDDLNVQAFLGNSYFVEFGDTQNPVVGTIYGTVFDDQNGNGLQEANEPGLAGVVISVTVSEGVITETTKGQGQYTYGFDIAEAGFHTVSEQDPAAPGYRSTTPDDVNVLVFLGNSYIVNFGDTNATTFSTLMGTVFDDASGEGIQDPGELGLADVTISLSDGQETTTNDHGGYTFGVTETGFVRVSETDPNGYHSTTPNTVTVNVAALGQLYTVNFGDSNNAFAASFFGTVFEDLNANGAWEAEEPPIEGVEVSISGGAFPASSNQWGQFTFLIESAGQYTVTETDLSGYVSTNAIAGSLDVVKIDNNTLAADVVLGTDLGDNLFGDVQASNVITISGSVWNDNGAGGGIPGDGLWNGTEPPLAEATVQLSTGMAQTTGDDGAFRLYALAGQTVTMTEVNPPGYLSTNAIAGNDATKVDNDTLRVSSSLAAGQTSAGNLFGDKLCTCLADAYEEDDTPAQASPLPVGSANAQSHDFCDDATDWITFTAQANTVYTITTTSWGQRADTYVAIFDTDGRTQLAANDDYENTTDFSSRIVWRAPGDGVYYVRITNRTGLSGCDTDYDVWIENHRLYTLYMPLLLRGHNTGANLGFNTLLSPTGVINHSCPDDYEIDDTWGQAPTIQGGALQIHSFDSDPRIFAADKDWSRFTGTAGRTVTFTIGAVTNTQPLIELYDEDGAGTGLTSETQLVWTPTTDGRYYVSVSPANLTASNFGCADTAGYALLMEEEPLTILYLPLLLRNR